MGGEVLAAMSHELGTGTTDDASLIPLVMSIVLRMIRIGMGEVLMRVVSFLFLIFWGWLFLSFCSFLFLFLMGVSV